MVELEFAQALENPNKHFSYNCSIPVDLGDGLSPHYLTGEANVFLDYFVDNDAVLNLLGSIRVPCKFVCDRCGGAFEKNLCLDISEKLYPNIDDPDDLAYDLPIIKLDDIISNYILLNFPSKVLCKDDCKGLCVRCGGNLNEGGCICKL